MIAAYLMLLGAVVVEVTGSTMNKLSQGFTVPLPTVLTLACFATANLLFSRVVLRLPLGPAYATWCAVGIIATSVISVVFLKGRIGRRGVVGVVLLVVGVVLVNISGVAG